MATTRIETIFTAQDRASAVMRQLGSNVDRLQGGFEKIQAPLLRAQTLWASLVSGAAVSGILALVNAIDDLDEAAQGLGTTAVDLAKIRQAGVEAGVGADKLNTALTKLNVNISEAAAGDLKAATLFGAFGNKALDAAVKSGNASEVLKQLADEFQKMGDGPAKAALAVDLFGKAGAAMVPLLNGGSASLERFTALTDQTVRETARLRGEIDKLGQSWEELKFRAAGAGVPAINNLLDALKRMKDSEFLSQRLLAAGSPSNVVAQGLLSLTRSYRSATVSAEMRNRALEEGAKLSGAEAVEANRGAQSVRDKAAADLAAAQAAKGKAKAINESSNAYAKEFADVQRIRNARRAFDQEQEDAANAERDRLAKRKEDLTGRSTERQQAEDLRLLTEAFRDGEIEALEFEMRKAKIFGRGNEVEQGMERQTELAKDLGLQISSSLGELITSGGKAGDVMKALGQDVLKLITQFLVLRPLAAELEKLFTGGGGSGGGGGFNFWGLLAQGVGAIAGTGTATGGGASPWGSTGDWFGTAAAASTGPINVFIDGAIDRARITSYVETGVRAGIAASVDSTLRGGSGTIG